VHGLQVKTIDNINVAFDNDTIGHWFEENKLLNDISGRLKKLPFAVATIKNPAKKWYQYRQTNYVQVYRKTTGGVIACMVTVLSNGQRRTYYTPNVSRLDDSVRKGFRVDVFNKKKKEPSN
jgi:hypothetical protein